VDAARFEHGELWAQELEQQSRTLYAAFWVIFGVVFGEYWYCAIAGLGVLVFGVLWLHELAQGRRTPGG
jgi:hypothetical protein